MHVLWSNDIYCFLEAKDEQIAMEEKYRNELNAHVKLSSLYKVRGTAGHQD